MENKPKPQKNQGLARWFIMYGFMVNPKANQIDIHDKTSILEIMEKLEVPRPVVAIDTKNNNVCFGLIRIFIIHVPRL